MTFDEVTCKLLAYYTAHPPGMADQWYGLWNTILTTLFPPTAGYVVTPQRKDYIEHSALNHIPDFIMEVMKVDELNLNMRVVLIFEIKNSQPSISFFGNLTAKSVVFFWIVRATKCTGLLRSARTGRTV